MNNKTIRSLVIINLILLTVTFLSKMQYIHKIMNILFKSFLIPIFITIFFFYIIKPLNDIFIRKGLKSGIAATLTLLISVFILSGLSSFLGKYIVAELKTISSQLSQISKSTDVINKIATELNRYIDMSEIYKEMNSLFKTYIQEVTRKVMFSFNYILNAFSNIFLILVILFYLLKDGYNFKEKIISSSSQKYSRLLDKILSDSDDVLSAYVTGQAKVALALSTMIFIGYKIIHMPNSLLFAFITFILAFIPFVGFFISMIIPSIIALTMGLSMVVKLGVTFIIVQTLKGRVAVPLIMGHTMKIHPLTDIFLVIGAVSIGGPIAAFIVVPVYAILKLTIKNIYKYKRSLLSDKI